MAAGRWAVVCGLVRTPDAALSKLRALAEWVERGFLEGVVVSWWHGEAERHPDVAKAIEDYGFVLVQTHQPRLKTLGHYIHQCKSLWLGLQAVPAGALVLKTRPDLHPISDGMRRRLERADLTAANSDGWPGPFQAKILAPWAFATSPFYIGDVTFFGVREDLLKLAAFDLSPEYTFSCYMPEQFFYFSPFRDHFPLLREYSYFLPPFIFDNASDSARLLECLLASDYYLDVLASHVLMLDRYFLLGLEDQPEQKAMDWSRIGLADLLSGRADIDSLSLLPGPHAAMFTDSRPVAALAKGRVRADDLGRRFLAAVERTRDYGYQARFDANPLRLGPAAAELKRSLDWSPEAAARVGEPTGEAGRLSVGGHADRVAFFDGSDQVEQLRAEISELRRQLDGLRKAGAAFGGGRL